MFDRYWASAFVAVILLCPVAAWAGALPAANCPAGAIFIEVGHSIQAEVNVAPPMARFCIGAGIHRMQSIVPKQGQQFWGLPGSIFNGSRVLTGFHRHGDRWLVQAEDPIGVDAGACARGHASCSRPAGLFIDGSPVQRAASIAELRQGQFFYDPERHRIVLQADPDGHLMEWAVTRHAFAGNATGVVVQGLVIEKYANPAQEGAVWPGGAGWTMRHVEARHNNGVGLVGGTGGAIEDCNIHENGQLGIGAGGATGLVIRRNHVWGNNANGFNAEWEAGGIKVAESQNVVFEGNHVHDNAGPGIWCDENCRDVLIKGNVVEANAAAGIFYEISSNATIADNVLRQNNTAGLPWFWGAEIQIAASSQVMVRGNTLTVRPFGKAVMLIDQNRPRSGGGMYQTRDNAVIGNLVNFLGDGSTGGASDAGTMAANYGIIQEGKNRFDSNDYTVQAGGTLRFVWGAGPLDIEAFRNAGQERNGTLRNGAVGFRVPAAE